MLSTQAYRIFQVVTAVAMIGWAAAYGYESRQYDQCTEAFGPLAESNQARIRNVQARIEKVRAREESLQARSGELIKQLNTPDGNADKKQP
jgi:hypothetical protein